MKTIYFLTFFITLANLKVQGMQKDTMVNAPSLIKQSKSVIEKTVQKVNQPIFRQVVDETIQYETELIEKETNQKCTVLGLIKYFYNPFEKIGKIEELETFQAARQGYGSQLLEAAIICLYDRFASQIKKIEWIAQPLEDDKRSNEQEVRKLIQFYIKRGAIMTRYVREDLYAEMVFPLQLAASLRILQPIFSTQETNTILGYIPDNNTWKIIVSYFIPEDFGYKKINEETML